MPKQTVRKTVDRSKLFPSDNSSYQICYRTLHILIHNGDPSSAKFSNDWLPVV
ncbi:hypothetical protein [Candidatus Tisiphia endosymbiont of Parasteatoda lunata]|uniref:hypothetical protein n=1 Tax=Candidatus Tisiphia endosymbiont of Parasteatoda lunata TaxID=3066275 RepID=UPI00313F13C7